MKNKIKAELWDKVQYIFKNYYDGMMHCAVQYDAVLNDNILRKAIKQVVDKIDILHSSFENSTLEPYWIINTDYSESDVLKVVNDDDFDRQIQLCLTRRIDCRCKLQFEITLIKGNNRSMLCFLVNHMCFDGRDFINFISYVTNAYNGLCDNQNYVADVKTGTRSAVQVYHDLPDELKKKAKGLYKNVSRTNIKNKFPFEKDAHDDASCIVIEELDAQSLSKAKARGKEEGYTVNDIYLSAYFRAVRKFVKNVEDSTPVEITSMLDLRRYIEGHDTKGFTNLTSYMPCKLESGVGETFGSTLKNVAKALKPHKENPLLGLAGLPLLSLALENFPFALSKLAVKIGYSNPLMSMSNIGIIKDEYVNMKGANAVKAFLTGTVKYKPYVQVACTTFKGGSTFTICEKCGDKDRAVMKQFLQYMTEQIKNYGDYKN